MKLIGLAGRAGAGKDTVAQFLCEAQGFVQIALADPLRNGLRAMFGLTHAQLADRTLKETPVDWLGKAPRELLQTLGTEWGRCFIASDVWLRVAARRVEAARHAAPCLHVGGVVVSDIRFDNEADWLRAQGGELWHVHRPAFMRPIACGCGGLCDSDEPCPMAYNAHTSERGIQFRTGDRVIDNIGTIDELLERVAEALGASSA